MSSFLCFICHSTVNSVTNEDMREKYRDVVSMNLCPDSHLCYICCHVLNRLWLFKAVCLKRSLEYPVLFTEKGTINLQRNDLEIYTVCSEECGYTYRNMNSKYYQYNYLDDANINEDDTINEYVQLHEEFDEFPKYNQDFEELNKVDNIEDNDSNSGVNNDDIDDNYSNDELNNDDNNADNDNDSTGAVDDMNNEEFDRNSPCELNEETEIKHEVDNEEEIPLKTKKKGKSKKIERFQKITLSVEEQKAELESKRRSKKYVEAEFKCSNCALGFLFKDTYQAHMMRHEESNGEYRCPICTLRFATPAVLRAHAYLHAERYRCVQCDSIVSRRRRTAHVADCDAIVDKAPCHLCGRVLKNSSGLQQHLKRYHRSARSRTAACNVCGRRYDNPAALRTHMIKHIQKKFTCEECSATFSSPYTLKQHQKKHTEPAGVHVCGTCSTTYSSRKSLLAHHRNVHQKESVQCPTCHIILSSKHSLSEHARGHAGAVACAACPDTRRSVRAARRHRATHAGGHVTLAVCHMCGAGFKGQNKLNRHVREVCQKNKLEEQLSSYYAQEILP